MTQTAVQVSVTSASLSAGNYSGSVTIYAPGASNSVMTVPITLTIKAATLSVSPSSLTLFAAVGSHPATENVQIANAGSGTLSYSSSVTSTWLNLSASSGSAPSSISVEPNANGLTAGTYSDTITISSPDAGNSPVAVPVSMQLGTLLFSDDFSMGAGNWTASPLGLASGWSVTNGVYSYDGSGHTQSWGGSDSWTDYTVAVDFQLSSLHDYPGGFRGRLNASNGASYGVWIYPEEQILKLYRIGQWNIDTDNTVLGQSGTLFIDTAVHNLRLSFQGSRITVYYDNVPVIMATDTTYTQGAVAFDVSSQPISFSNVKVIGF